MAALMRTSMAVRPVITSMSVNADLLTLTQWLSPAFPVGAFAYSHGIETAIRNGWITDAVELEAWLRDCLSDGSGRADAIWLRLAHGSKDPLAIDAKARAFALSHERLREASRQGAAFVATVNAVWDHNLPELLLPVAVGRAAGLAGFDADMTVMLYLQSFVTNLTSAALRLAPLGQTEGQGVILRLRDICLQVAAETKEAGEETIFGNAFLSDITAMTHETLQPRLFQS